METMSEPDQKPNEKLSTNSIALIMISVAVSIVLAYAAFIIWKTWPISGWSVGQSGVFGDSFGIITALFSGLAFAGLIWAILLQRDDLRLQKVELALTREVLKDQKEQLRKQNETMGHRDVHKFIS